MASTFQNRLAGTVIVVALAVIFLPDLLDGKITDTASANVKIPGKPTLEPARYDEQFPLAEIQSRSSRQVEIVQDIAVDESDKIDDTLPSNSEKLADEVDNSRSETPVAETATDTKDSKLIDFPVADTSPPEVINKSWVIQLGSFKHAKNVRDLIDKLNKSGYRVFTNKVKTSSGNLTKVFVGPDLKKDKLQNAIPHLNELTGLKGRLTEFDVQ